MSNTNINQELNQSVDAVKSNNLITRPDAPIVILSDILREMGLSGVRVPAEQLVDTSFVIMRAKAFQSSFNQESHAYFVVAKDTSTGEIFTTVLGGQAVVDILDALTSAGFDSQLQVTLRTVSGGRYGRYYVLE